MNEAQALQLVTAGREHLERRVTEPGVLSVIMGPDGGCDCVELAVLDVERQRDPGAAAVEKIVERWDVVGELVATEGPDGGPTEPLLDHAVVVEDGDAIGRRPDIAFEAGRAESPRKLESLERVLARVGPGPAMRESDWRVEQ